MQISVSSQTTLLNSANFFVFALYDASAPSVLLESQQPAKPYGNPLQITFAYNCQSGHIYIIKLWESADSTPTGVVRNSFSQAVNSGTSSVTLKMDEYLEVGVTSGLTAGATTYDDVSWAGWQYSIERIGMGTMVPDNSTDTSPNYTQKVTGGFTLIQSGDTFQSNEKFVVRFIPIVTTVPQAGAVSALFSAGRVITADTSLTNSDSDQALFIQSATNKINLYLPALSTINDYTFFYLYSNGGSHINARIAAYSAFPVLDKFQFNTLLRSSLYLGQGEMLVIFKANGFWQIANDIPGINSVGESFYSYKNTLPNAIIKDGSLLDRTVYPRLWEWVSGLDSSSIVTDTAWSSTSSIVDGITYYTKKGFFSSGDGSTTFRIPDARYMTSKGIAATDAAGRFEMEQIITHQHEQTIASLPSIIFGRGLLRRLLGQYNGVSNNVADLSGLPVDSNGNLITRVGTKNLIDNIGEYPMIRI